MTRTIADLPFESAAKYGDRPALRFKRDGKWQDQSFVELAGTVRAIAGGLIEAGVSPGDRVCILGETSPSWTQLGLGVIAAGAVVVPIYPTSSTAEREWIVSNSGAKMVLDPAAPLPSGDEERRAAVDPGDPCLIIYTSGTTGPPKGCVLTHRNWLTLCEITEELSYVTADDVVYLFLPLAHVFAQLIQFGAVYSGATLA
jgi:long-chain acyl-CoA synthetase